MNQPKVRFKEDKCIKCKKPFLMPYHYDRHLSDWVCYQIPICEVCRMEKMWKKNIAEEIAKEIRHDKSSRLNCSSNTYDSNTDFSNIVMGV